MKLYLVRHGEEYRADMEVHGHMDVPLSARGFEQANDLVSKLMTEGVKYIYSSDLTRAIQTAMPLSKAAAIGINADDRLRPVKLGEMEGKTFAEVDNQLEEWETAWLTDPTVSIPGGDSFESFQARNVAFFRELAAKFENDDKVAVFTHSRNCHLIQHWAANDMRPLTHGTEDLLHHCDHQLGTYQTYQIDRTSNLTRLSNAGQKGRSFTMRFIEPGLVRYEDVGDVLVQKPCLDEMAQSFVGCPVFDRTHKDTSDTDFSRGKADGIVVRVWYDGNDGWYWCEALIWDPDTILHMTREGYGLSCAYDVLKWAEGEGTWHNIPYQNEVTQGRYTHLAIVKKPRYEDVRIIANQGGSMKLKFWEKDKKPEDAPSEVELTNSSKVEVEPGKEETLETVLAGYRAEQARKQELENAKKLGPDTLIDVDGVKVALKDIVAGHKAHLANEAANSMKEDHEDGKHKGNPMESCGYCSNERKNEEEEEERKRKEKEKENALENEKKEKERLEALRKARNNGQEPKMPDAPSDREDRLKAGTERYGVLSN